MLAELRTYPVSGIGAIPCIAQQGYKDYFNVRHPEPVSHTDMLQSGALGSSATTICRADSRGMAVNMLDCSFSALSID